MLQTNTFKATRNALARNASRSIGTHTPRSIKCCFRFILAYHYAPNHIFKADFTSIVLFYITNLERNDNPNS